MYDPAITGAVLSSPECQANDVRDSDFPGLLDHSLSRPALGQRRFPRVQSNGSVNAHRLAARLQGSCDMNSRLDTPAEAADRSVALDRSSARFAVESFSQPSAIEREWRQLEASGVGTVFQRYDWVDAYVRHVLPHEAARTLIVLGRLHGNPAFILPLSVSRIGPVRVARWIGGNHSSYNFGLWSHEAAAVVAGMTGGEIARLLRSAMKGVDCAVLGRTPRLQDDVAQPLAELPRSPSATEGYSFSLAGGFAGVLERTNGKSRRKKIVTRERKMGEAGALDIGIVRDRDRAHTALDFFAAQKALRLSEQGRANSFAAPGVMEFFHDLLERSQTMREPVLEMAELSVDGQMRAVNGAAIYRGRVNVYFMAFAKDELTAQSPGQVLNFRHIEECCKRGMSAYDLGIGYEDYKTQWCDVVHELDDVYAAFTPLGSAAVAATRLGEAGKNLVRRNEPLWQSLKSLRDRLSRRSPVSAG